jgi:hypothetical protein
MMWLIDIIPSELPSQEDVTSFKRKIESLSNEAQEVIKVIFNSPLEITEFRSKKVNKRGTLNPPNISSVRSYCRKRLSWKCQTADLVICEIKEMLDD